MLVEGGGEAVVVQAGLERIHPLGRTIHMFWRPFDRSRCLIYVLLVI